MTSTQCPISRVLRIPGTLNHKNGTSAPVEILRIDWDLRYEPSHFDDWRAEITEDPTPAAQAMPAAFPWSKHEVLCENFEGYSRHLGPSPPRSSWQELL